MNSDTICFKSLGVRRAVADVVLRSLFLGAALVLALLMPSTWAVERGSKGDLSPASARPDLQRVMLGSFRAFDAGGQVLVRWETVLEVEVMTFDLYRGSGPDAVKVNRSPVVAQGNLIGGRYEVLDSTASAPGTYHYRVVATLVNGRSIEVTACQAAATERVAREDVALQRSQPRTPDISPAPTPARGSVKLASPPTPIYLPNSDVAVKLTLITNQTGMHFVSARSLGTLLGQTEAEVANWLNAGSVALYNRGQQVKYYPGTGWVAPPNVTGVGLFFCADLHQNNYTYRNVYFLKAGTNTKRETDGQNPAPAAPWPYWAAHAQEVDYAMITAYVFEPEADFWVWDSLVPGGADTKNYACAIDHLITGAGTNALLTVRLRGAGSLGHRVEASINGNVLGEVTWSGQTAAEGKFSFPSTYLTEPTTTATFKALFAPGVSSDTVYVDRFRLDFTRSYCATSTATAGRFEGGADTNSTVTVTNFVTTSTVSPPPAPNIMVFDISNPRNLALVDNVNVSLQGSAGTSRRWQASFVPDAAANRYAVVQYPSLRLSVSYPETLSLAYPAYLKDTTNQGSYVVIAPASLTNSARILADYRSPSFRTKWVDLEHIYNEFSDGLVTPHAISNFLKTAYFQWTIPPRYAVLVGDGTIKYREFTAPNDNLVPPLMITTDFGLFASDKFGAVGGEATPRIAVGRFPVLSETEFNNMLAKIQAYEAKSVSLPLKALLVADQPDGAGHFIENVEELADILAPRYTSTLVHPPPTGAIDYNYLRQRVQTELNDGVDVMTYVGHGAQDRIGSTGPGPDYIPGYQNVVNTSDPNTTVALTLANGSRLPIVTAMTCVVGNFSLDNYQSMGEVLVTQPNSGAVAIVSPTGPSYDSDAVWLNRRFMQELACSGSVRLGDLVLQAFSLYNRQGNFPTPIYMYGLLGDPALLITSPTSP